MKRRLGTLLIALSIMFANMLTPMNAIAAGNMLNVVIAADENNIVTVRGYYDEGAGKEVSLLVKKPTSSGASQKNVSITGMTDIQLLNILDCVDQTTTTVTVGTGANSYNFEFRYKSSAITGKYTIYLGAEEKTDAFVTEQDLFGSPTPTNPTPTPGGGSPGGGGGTQPTPTPTPTATPDGTPTPTPPGGGDDAFGKFTDVSSSEWYYDSIKYVVDNTLMKGIWEDKFEPDTSMTRAMIITVLARYAGVDTTTGGREWWERAVEWGISNGVTDGEYLEDNVTREQLATLLWRYSNEPTGTGDLSKFSDKGEVSDWAENALKWAIEIGLIKGDDYGTLRPQDNASRAEVAAIIHRFIEATK